MGMHTNDPNEYWTSMEAWRKRVERDRALMKQAIIVKTMAHLTYIYWSINTHIN